MLLMQSLLVIMVGSVGHIARVGPTRQQSSFQEEGRRHKWSAAALPAKILGIIGSATNYRPVVESGKPLFQLIPDAVDAYRLCGERTTSALSYKEQPLIRKPWTARGRHIPNPVYILPSDRFSLSSWVFACNLVFGNQQPEVAGNLTLWKPRFKDGDQEAETEKPGDEPAG